MSARIFKVDSFNEFDIYHNIYGKIPPSLHKLIFQKISKLWIKEHS